MGKFLTTLLILIFLISLVSYITEQSQKKVTIYPTPSPAAPTRNNVLGVRTKTIGCVMNGPMQDKECTPGAVFQNVTVAQVCTPGYSSSARNVPTSIKNQVYTEYGIATHRPGQYEVDHLISLELGGSNDIANLWPEAAEPRPGYHEKDTVENYLHAQVCNGAMTLQQAQAAIANNWLSIYQQIQ